MSSMSALSNVAQSSQMTIMEAGSVGEGQDQRTFAVLRDADSTQLDYRQEANAFLAGPGMYTPPQDIVVEDRKPPPISNGSIPNRPLRPHSTPATLLWLEENYEIAEGVCIPRSALYLHYVDFCARNAIQPVNAASFGKIIRQQFPQLTTRRLGTRGQSRYHYYGIAVRENSIYYQMAYSKKAIASSTEGNVGNGSGGNGSKGRCESQGQNLLSKEIYGYPKQANGNRGQQPSGTGMATASASRPTAATLAEFPTLKDVHLPSSLDSNKVSTLLMMYRTHCQRILDTISRANFDEVQTLLIHFWRGVPPHLAPLLDSNAAVSLIAACDCVLYKAIAAVLMPTLLQAMPDSLNKVTRKFASELDYWTKMALYSLPDNARNVKVELARRFGTMLRRQASLSHVAHAARMVVNNTELISQLISDWSLLDINRVTCEAVQMAAEQSGLEANEQLLEMMRSASRSFERLLHQDASIEAHLEWLDSLFQQCVVYPALQRRSSMRRLASHFLIAWSSFGACLAREMTVRSAASFGSLHLLRLMLDDYVLYLVEYVSIDKQAQAFLALVATDQCPQTALQPRDPYLSEQFGSEHIMDQIEQCSSFEPPVANAQPSSVGHNSNAGEEPAHQPAVFCCAECSNGSNMDSSGSNYGEQHSHYSQSYNTHALYAGPNGQYGPPNSEQHYPTHEGDYYSSYNYM